MSNLSITLPVISNIEEARKWNKDFKSILTVGPSPSEVQWNHQNHRIFEFGDTTSGPYAPKIEDIRDAVMWGAEQEDLLVHCHAGMSRSTATAWGISIARGADHLDSFISLKKAHPKERYGTRSFIPNTLIVKHLMEIFDLNDLEDITREHKVSGWFQ